MKTTDRDDPRRILINNSAVDTRPWDEHFVAVVRDGKPLPEELDDLFVVTVHEDRHGRFGVITMR